MRDRFPEFTYNDLLGLCAILYKLNSILGLKFAILLLVPLTDFESTSSNNSCQTLLMCYLEFLAYNLPFFLLDVGF